MILFTLTQTSVLTRFYNIQPFVFCAKPSSYTLAAFWVTTFGAPDESDTSTVNISQIVQDYLIGYTALLNSSDVLTTPKSFYWDNAAQLLWLHIEHASSPDTSVIQQGRSYGFCDTQLIYLDGIEFKPLLKSVPAIAQCQDFLGYSKLALINGDAVLNNVGGELDYLIDIPIYGNDANTFYLQERAGVSDYSFEEVIRISSLYVDDFEMSQQEMILHLMDKRNAGGAKIPTETFTASAYPYLADTYVNQVIPLAFGTIRISKAIPTNTNTTGTTTFRQALTLTSLGTVQVKIADVWTTKTPTATDLANGSFTLSSADSRSGTTVFECRVLGSVGIDIDTAADVIVYLNNRYLDLAYNESNYNIAEWSAADAMLSEVGVVFDSQIEIAEAILQLQGGANVGFRYEIDPDGRRTIRIDDPDRAESFTIHNEDIMDIEDLGFKTDRSLLAASVKVEYAKDFNQGESLISRSIANYDYVKETYRLIPELEFKTLLPNSTLADARALAEANKYMDVPKFLTVKPWGSDFLRLRIYDVGTAELTMGFVDLDSEAVTATRPWLGVWKVQVLDVAPDLQALSNTVRLALLEKKF